MSKYDFGPNKISIAFTENETVDTVKICDILDTLVESPKLKISNPHLEMSTYKGEDMIVELGEDAPQGEMVASELEAHGDQEGMKESSSEEEEPNFLPECTEENESDQSVAPKRVDGGAMHTVSSETSQSWSHPVRSNVCYTVHERVNLQHQCWN